jgi:hypothetical protein
MPRNYVADPRYKKYWKLNIDDALTLRHALKNNYLYYSTRVGEIGFLFKGYH